MKTELTVVWEVSGRNGALVLRQQSTLVPQRWPLVFLSSCDSWTVCPVPHKYGLGLFPLKTEGGILRAQVFNMEVKRAS